MRTPFLRLLHGGRNNDPDPPRKATDEECAMYVLYPTRRLVEVAPQRPPVRDDDDPPKDAA
jgi:hypothetical protein